MYRVLFLRFIKTKTEARQGSEKWPHSRFCSLNLKSQAATFLTLSPWPCFVAWKWGSGIEVWGPHSNANNFHGKAKTPELHRIGMKNISNSKKSSACFFVTMVLYLTISEIENERFNYPYASRQSTQGFKVIIKSWIELFTSSYGTGIFNFKKQLIWTRKNKLKWNHRRTWIKQEQGEKVMLNLELRKKKKVK